jgi:Skp family chaperone for outer membrane proteins
MVAALALTLGLAGQARAQSTGTRVAVVNIGTVFTKYDKATRFKSDMEATLKPYKDKAEEYKKNILAYQAGINDPQRKEKEKEAYAQAIRDLKRRLEDLDLEARKAIGGKQETHLIQLFREVSDHIKAVSLANGIHLVMGFGEPPDADLYTFANINRKLTGMDMGGSVPLYYHSSLDISEVVVASLNRSVGGGVPATPTGGSSQK